MDVISLSIPVVMDSWTKMFKSIGLQCTFGSISERFLKIWAEVVATVCGLNRNLKHDLL